MVKGVMLYRCFGGFGHLVKDGANAEMFEIFAVV